jgi:hypothetical protein
MKMPRLYLLLVASLFGLCIFAQSKTTTTQNKQPTNTTPAKTTNQNAQQPSLSAQTDSLKLAADDIKKSFNTLFGGKRDTIVIAVANVEFDDTNLAILKEQLKKMKGVKGVVMQYKGSSAMLEVSFKGKATDLWDKLPDDAKTPFKIVEAGENSLMVELRK